MRLTAIALLLSLVLPAAAGAEDAPAPAERLDAIAPDGTRARRLPARAHRRRGRVAGLRRARRRDADVPQSVPRPDRGASTPSRSPTAAPSTA